MLFYINFCAFTFMADMQINQHTNDHTVSCNHIHICEVYMTN